MKPLYWVILGVIVLIPAVYVGMDLFGDRAAPPNKLVEEAISGKDKDARILAISHLTMQKDKATALKGLLRVAREVTDTEVKIAALNALSAYHDLECWKLLLKCMEDDPERKVRKAAFEGVIGFYPGKLPDNLEYKIDDPGDKRAQVVKRLMELRADEEAEAKLKAQTTP